MDPLDAFMAELEGAVPQADTDGGGLDGAGTTANRAAPRRRQGQPGAPTPSTVRNRRFRELQALLGGTSVYAAGYFSDDAMEERAPGLFADVLGRHLRAQPQAPVAASGGGAAAADAAAQRAARPLTTMLMAALQRQCAPDGVGSEANGGGGGSDEDEVSMPDDDGDEVTIGVASSAEAAGAGAGAGAGISVDVAVAAVGRLGLGAVRSSGSRVVASGSPSDADSDAAAAVSIADRRAELVRLMSERFLRGDDGDAFPHYAAVDGDDSADACDEAAADAQEMYFDRGDDNGALEEDEEADAVAPDGGNDEQRYGGSEIAAHGDGNATGGGVVPAPRAPSQAQR